MRIAILGYGSMGHEIEKVLTTRGHEVTARVDPRAPGVESATLTPQIASDSDMAIDFTVPSEAVSTISACADLGLSLVMGTTGWYENLEGVRKTVGESSIGLLYGSNFSVGAHLFFALAARASQLVSDLADYDIALSEIHHKRKKDSPSGTALSAGRVILESCPRKTSIVTERLDRPIEPHELHISSLRGGEFPGQHTVYLDSAFDTLQIGHTARNRGGFALGAVLGAEWLQGKRGVYEVAEFAQELLK